MNSPNNQGRKTGTQRCAGCGLEWLCQECGSPDAPETDASGKPLVYACLGCLAPIASHGFCGVCSEALRQKQETDLRAEVEKLRVELADHKTIAAEARHVIDGLNANIQGNDSPDVSDPISYAVAKQMIDRITDALGDAPPSQRHGTAPSSSNTRKAKRGLVTEKHRIRTIFGGHFCALVVCPEDDAACQDWIEAPKALWESVTIAGLGDDTIVEYGIGKPDIPRRVT